METILLGSSTGSESKSDPPNPTSAGWASAVFGRGWVLGKKAAIAGAAIMATPIVVPPLLLFSTVGAALAVPFGVYFASLACTDRLMRSLLPPIYPELPQKVDDEDEFVEAVEETKSNQALEEDEEKPTEEEEVGEGREVEEERTPSREVEIEEHDSSLETVGVTKSTNLLEEEEPKAEEVQVQVQVDVIDATQSATGGSVFLVADVIQKEEKSGAVKVFDEMLVLTEETGDGVERVVIVEGKEVSTNNEVQESSFDVVAVAAMETEEGENEVIEVASISSEYASAVADDESRSSIDHVEDAKDANSVVGVETENSKPSNVRKSFGNNSMQCEQLWVIKLLPLHPWQMS
ncbi:uncharacterized protein [Typha latifolia]|uniref:uncharacterized protein isoform X2 n=1 Tax=Typha latifolia TaxID=4733 RepID=UPI003C303DD0